MHAPPGVCWGLLVGIIFGEMDQPAGFFMSCFYFRTIQIFLLSIFSFYDRVEELNKTELVERWLHLQEPCKNSQKILIILRNSFNFNKL